MTSGYAIATLVVFIISTFFVIHPVSVPTPRPIPRIPINLTTAPILAIALLWAAQCLNLTVIRDGFVGTEGVKPYNILILFFSLAYMAITLDITGILQAAMFWVSNKGGDNGWKLYLYFYVMFTLLSILLGNDPVILSGTAFLVYYTQVAQLDPRAWIMTQFAAANTASMVLFVGNPTNVVICEGFSVNNAAFTAYTILPFLTCNLFCFVALAFQYRNRVPRKLTRVTCRDPRSALLDPVGAWVGSFMLGTALILCLVVSFLGIDVWMISLPFAVGKFLFDLGWDHYRYSRGIPMLNRREGVDEGSMAEGREVGPPCYSSPIDVEGLPCFPPDDAIAVVLHPASPETESKAGPLAPIPAPEAEIKNEHATAEGNLCMEGGPSHYSPHAELVEGLPSFPSDEAITNEATTVGFHPASPEIESKAGSPPTPDAEIQDEDSTAEGNPRTEDDPSPHSSHTDVEKVPSFPSDEEIHEATTIGLRPAPSKIESEAWPLPTPTLEAEIKNEQSMTEGNPRTGDVSFPHSSHTDVDNLPSFPSDEAANETTTVGLRPAPPKIESRAWPSPLPALEAEIKMPYIFRWHRSYLDNLHDQLDKRFPTFITALPRLPFALVPFVFSQFILIEALDHQGWVNVFAGWLVRASHSQVHPTIWLIGVLGIILCNLSGTNIGATILLTKVVHAAALPHDADRAAAIALAVASNIGAVSFMFSASLAGLLWRGILMQKGIYVRQREFAVWNLLPLLAMTTVGLGIVSAEMAVLFQSR